MIEVTKLINPNYLLIFPELILIGVTLVVLVADLYSGAKRTLGYVSLLGVLAALASLWPAFTGQVPVGDYFGGMLRADNFAFFMKAVLLGAAALVILMSLDFVGKRLPRIQVEYYELLLFATLGLMLMASSRDIAMIYVGLELASQSSYVMAGLLRKDPKSNEAALKYFLNGILASAVLLFGISILYGLSGATHLDAMSKGLMARLATHPDLFAVMLIAVTLVIGGFAFKVAAAPFHLWAPDVYEGAPTPVTGFFSVGPKSAAFIAIARVFLVGLNYWWLEWTLLWAILSAFSMCIGNLTALMQTNIKRMMAYSSIAQAGYILVAMAAMVDPVQGGALGSVSTIGEGPLLFYLLSYALTNLGLFAIIIAVENATGSTQITAFSGLAQRAPIYAWAMTFLFLSLIGVPPAVGFFAKFYLFNVAVTANYTWLALLMAVNSVISVGYYYGIVRQMFFVKSDESAMPVSGSLAGVVAISTLGVLVVGLLSEPFLNYLGAFAR